MSEFGGLQTIAEILRFNDGSRSMDKHMDELFSFLFIDPIIHSTPHHLISLRSVLCYNFSLSCRTHVLTTLVNPHLYIYVICLISARSSRRNIQAEVPVL